MTTPTYQNDRVIAGTLRETQASALAALAAAQQSGPIAPGAWFDAQQLLVDSVVPGLQGWGEKLGSVPGGATMTFPTGVTRRAGGGVSVSAGTAAICPIAYSLATNAKTKRWAFAAQFKCPSVPRTGHESCLKLVASTHNISFGSVYDVSVPAQTNFAVNLYIPTTKYPTDTGIAGDTNWHDWLLCFDLTTIRAYIDYVLVASITDLTGLTTGAIDAYLASYAEDMEATLAWYAHEPAL